MTDFEAEARGLEDRLFAWTTDADAAGCAWPAAKIRELISTALQAARAEALEEAARECDRITEHQVEIMPEMSGEEFLSHLCGQRIRALASAPNGRGEK